MKNLIILSSLFIFALLFVNQNSNAGLNQNTNLQYKGVDSAQVCIVSGETITGDGVKYKYLNKEFTFCCGGCEKSFKKEPVGYIKEGLHCPVCNEDDAKKELSHTHDNVKYYFCGNGCKKKFEGDAQKYLDNYNK